MAGTTRAVTPDALGAWLVKASPGTSSVEELLSLLTGATERCLRRSYRTDLVAPGQPVLLWVSGHCRDLPAGIHAQGRSTSPAREVAGRGLAVGVELEPLEQPVLREELLADPLLHHLEVLRMPAGSNPSFLTRTELSELSAQWPQVTVG